MNVENNFLVSVYVITYNSSKYILETLNSIKSQTYQNIELVISDDSSTDNTVEICQNWLIENKDRFIDTVILTVPSNTGVTANCNRAIRAAKGIWMKGIAGDDVLMPDCIKDNVDYVSSKSDIYLVQSDNMLIDENSEPIVKTTKKSIQYKHHVFNHEKITAEEQHRLLLYSSNIIPATLFVNKKLYELVGGYDESIPMMEDRPFNLKVTANGYKFYYFPKITVKYRVHAESIMTNSLNCNIINRNSLSHIKVAEKYVYNSLNCFELCIKKYYAYVTRAFFGSKLNNKTISHVIIWNLLKLPDLLCNKITFLLVSLSLKRKWKRTK